MHLGISITVLIAIPKSYSKNSDFLMDFGISLEK